MDNFSADTKVEYVISQWPQVIPVFNRHRMGCVGCSMACFETVAGAASIYHLSLDQFIDELQGAIETPASGS